MKKFLRKRGADTNQNIFYLVIAVIVLAAAAFGLDQGLRALNRSDARQAAASVSNQTRALFANIGVLPTPADADIGLLREVLNSDVLPGNIVNRDPAGIAQTVSLPNGGSVETIFPTSGNTRDFTVAYEWASNTGRAQGICNSLISGSPAGTRVESGGLGLDYTVLTGTCAATTPTITVQYHR